MSGLLVAACIATGGFVGAGVGLLAFVLFEAREPVSLDPLEALACGLVTGCLVGGCVGVVLIG